MYFKLSALGLLQQVSICISKTSPAVTHWGEQVIRGTRRRDERTLMARSVEWCNQVEGHGFLSFLSIIQLSDFTALALEATLAWEGCLKLCTCPRSSGPCTWITLTQSRVIMSELRVVYPLTFVLGVFLFSFWLFDESYVSLKEWGFFCVNQGYIYPWPLNWLFKILLLLIWINIFWTIMWPLTIAKNSSRALADVDFFL